MYQQEFGLFPMVAIPAVSRQAVPNRRRRVRHKIQTPAYASFASESKGTTLDLHEIVDISEDGVAIQCHSPLHPERPINLCLDLAECPAQIYTPDTSSGPMTPVAQESVSRNFLRIRWSACVSGSSST